jgi:predicted lipase
VEVYTFGCPRVGNASFSAAYDKLVPETWHVINDRDTVGRGFTTASYFVCHEIYVCISSTPLLARDIH